MLNESRRRAYLTAMQVVNWLPRTELPFAAPSRPEVMTPVPPPIEPLAAVAAPITAKAASARPVSVAVTPTAPPVIERPRVEVARPSLASTRTNTVAEAQDVAPAPSKTAVVPPPRFALQLLRAGPCLLLVELPTGEAFQSRDPAYLLLKDMLRAAGLPDSPRIIGEPVRWPLLVRGQLDQGPDSARDFVQGFVLARLEDEPCACLWLIGLPSIRFAGEANAESFNRELQIDGLGSAWALPGLELLMDEPQRKADVWLAMRRLMTRWKTIE
ncbi:energy transducer TonB [Pseudomonas sp.]|uniref:energy transducer TonB n=1 Tax=Pseudomonas sp. TaxID=306 RepID=UPI0026220A72|nr:energy transducer TonB [Pseudomonas sp.]